MKIGVTGGIGSGKTTVCKVLEAMGYVVYYSDLEAKNIMLFNSNVKKSLIAVFGDEVYENDQLNRPYLAERIFADSSLRNKINEIVHPEVRNAFDDFYSKNKTTLVFNEAAILFETGAYKQFDATLLITADEQIRIGRVVKRDNVTAEMVQARIQAQMPDETKIELADYVIVNNNNASVVQQIEAVVQELLKKK